MGRPAVSLRDALAKAAAAEPRDEEQALADYSRANELKPTAPIAYKRRGQLLLKRGATAAGADLTRAQDLEPGDSVTANLLAAAQQAVAAAERPVASSTAPPSATRVAAPCTTISGSRRP